MASRLSRRFFIFFCFYLSDRASRHSIIKVRPGYSIVGRKVNLWLGDFTDAHFVNPTVAKGQLENELIRK